MLRLNEKINPYNYYKTFDKDNKDKLRRFMFVLSRWHELDNIPPVLARKLLGAYKNLPPQFIKQLKKEIDTLYGPGGVTCYRLLCFDLEGYKKHFGKGTHIGQKKRLVSYNRRSLFSWSSAESSAKTMLHVGSVYNAERAILLEAHIPTALILYSAGVFQPPTSYGLSPAIYNYTKNIQSYAREKELIVWHKAPIIATVHRLYKGGYTRWVAVPAGTPLY